MFNQPKFEISASPISKSVIQEHSKCVSKIRRINLWLNLPVVILVFYLVWVAEHIFAEYSVNVLSHNGEIPISIIMTGLVIPVAQILSGLLLFTFFLLIFYSWISTWNSMAWSLQTIDIALADEVLALAEKHPEIDAYRAAIVKDREVTNGDLEAMRQFDLAAIELDRVSDLREHNEDSFRRVHQPTTRSCRFVSGHVKQILLKVN